MEEIPVMIKKLPREWLNNNLLTLIDMSGLLRKKILKGVFESDNIYIFFRSPASGVCVQFFTRVGLHNKQQNLNSHLFFFFF